MDQGWGDDAVTEQTRELMRIRTSEFRDYAQVDILAGPLGTERVVPPAGENYAFDRLLWRKHVTVSVSPKGRSVRVWIDGKEVLE